MNAKAATIIGTVVFGITCILWIATAGHSSLPTLTYSQFLDKVQAGQIASVVLTGSQGDAVQTTCRLKDGTSLRTVLPSDDKDALAAMLEKKVEVEIRDPSSGYLRLLIQFTPLFLCLGLWAFLIIRQGPNGPFFRALMGR